MPSAAASTSPGSTTSRQSSLRARSVPAPFQLEPDRAGLEASTVVGRCAGLAEGVGGADFFRGFLSSRYDARTAELSALLDAGGCRLKNLRASWARTQAQSTSEQIRMLCATAGGTSDPTCDFAPAIAVFPFARGAIGEILLSIAAPVWFSKYADDAKNATPKTP